jgi:hypothetical protein
MRKFISIVEALNEASPVKPVQPVKPVKPMTPGDPRHTAQNTTAVNDPAPGTTSDNQNGNQNAQNNPTSPQRDDTQDKNDPNAAPIDGEVDGEVEGDEEDAALDQGIDDGKRAQEYLRKHGIHEGHEQGELTFGGQPIKSGVADLHQGLILRVYGQAVPIHLAEIAEDDDEVLFTVENGEVNVKFFHPESGGPMIKKKLEKRIRAQLD